MTSPISANIGVAAAKAVPAQPAAQQPVGQQVNAGQIVNASQAASEKKTTQLGQHEKTKDTQVPKRVESSFNSQAKKAKPGVAPKEEQREESNREKGGLDVIA